jgi:hypothetical protein
MDLCYSSVLEAALIREYSYIWTQGVLIFILEIDGVQVLGMLGERYYMMVIIHHMLIIIIGQT